MADRNLSCCRQVCHTAPIFLPAILLALSVNILTSLPTWPSPSGLDSTADTMTGNAEAATAALGVAEDAEGGSVSLAGLHCSTVSSRSPTFIPPTLDTSPRTAWPFKVLPRTRLDEFLDTESIR